MGTGARRGTVRRASISKANYEGGCREREPAKRFVQYFLYAAHAGVQALIERCTADLGLRSMRLPSGAGHDAQMAAWFGPMGMIFVPSVGGVSHSPKELTS